VHAAMPRKKTVRMSKAVRDMAPLRSEVRALGVALGRVITLIEGPATFDMVEALRKAAKARRANEAGAERQLAKLVAGLEPRDAFNQAMAFTLYFELVNLAEENFRIILLRRRRVASALGQDEGRPIRESIEAAVMELKAAGVDAAAMQRLVDSLAIELVFTAHPTETKRRTLLAKLGRLAGILRARALPESTPDAAILTDETVDREIASLWLTDRSRTAKPEVKDEARTGLWYFDTTLIETMPRLQVDMERALARHYPGVKAPPKWLSFGSWIGGDRDGNPEVTAATTAEVLVLHRRLAIEKLRHVASELSKILTVSDRRDTVVPALKRELQADLHLSQHLAELEKRFAHEPYRLLLGVFQERLGQALDELKDGPALLAGPAAGSALSRAMVAETLGTAPASRPAAAASWPAATWRRPRTSSTSSDCTPRSWTSASTPPTTRPRSPRCSAAPTTASCRRRRSARRSWPPSPPPSRWGPPASRASRPRPATSSTRWCWPARPARRSGPRPSGSTSSA
jgi:phosphoenolpyruvate carboxylase